MAMYVAEALELREGDRSKFGFTDPVVDCAAALATRARILLLAVEDVPNTEIAERTATSTSDGAEVARPLRGVGDRRACR